MSHKTHQSCNVLLELKCGGLLLDRHEPPFTRRFVVYFRTALYTYAPVLRALATLGRGNPADSVERLEFARPYELAVNGLNFPNFNLGGLHSAYVRGEALIAAHRYAEAAAEFQKILNHRGIVGMDPIGALAHWRLGRTYTLSGDKAKAKSAYDAFLALWKHADPEIPILKQAKAEYSKL